MFFAVGVYGLETIAPQSLEYEDVDAAQEQEPVKKISLDFPNTPLSTVMGVLSLKTGKKFIADANLSQKRIVLSLKNVTADEALNALLDTYDLYYVKQGETDIYVIKSKKDAIVTTVSKVFFINYHSAKDLLAAIQTKVSQHGNVTADEKNNSLIVTDVADNVDKMEELLRALDIPPLQILLEAKVVDVRLGTQSKFGLQVNELYRDSRVSSSGDKEANYQQNYAPGEAASSWLSMAVVQDDYRLNAILEAVKIDNNAKLITSPRIVVLNNNEAVIDIVEEIPYIETDETSISAGTSKTTVAFKEVGIKLKVKPHINRDGSIILNVNPEQSFRTGETQANTPVISKSMTNTTFMLQNGETVIIGGLIKETESKSEYKVPLLGDIPVVGFLFKKYAKEKIRTELTIFITAKIIK